MKVKVKFRKLAYILAGALIIPVIAEVAIDIDTAARVASKTMTILAPKAILKTRQIILVQLIARYIYQIYTYRSMSIFIAIGIDQRH